MSFFRVLLALLISAGIAYGLYLAVDEQRLERAVEAVRTEIIAPAIDAVQGDAPTDADEEEAEAEIEAEPLADNSDAAPEEAVISDEPAEAEPTTFAARVEEGAARAEAEAEAVEAAATEITAAAEPEVTESEAADSVDTTGENDLPRIATMPAPPETTLPDDAQAPAAMEIQSPLSTARIVDDADEDVTTETVEIAETAETTDAAEIADATGTATAALDIVNGGMNYVEARETLIEAGWSPRLPATRTGGPNDAENAMIEAGYGELEGCNDADRPICRFEFVDGEKRIAAVLTAGAGTDPTVIDAFLMNIRAE